MHACIHASSIDLCACIYLPVEGPLLFLFSCNPTVPAFSFACLSRDFSFVYIAAAAAAVAAAPNGVVSAFACGSSLSAVAVLFCLRDILPILNGAPPASGCYCFPLLQRMVNACLLEPAARCGCCCCCYCMRLWASQASAIALVRGAPLLQQRLLYAAADAAETFSATQLSQVLYAFGEAALEVP